MVGLNEWVVLVFDNRGIGSSKIPEEKKNDPYTVGDMAQDVIELVKVPFLSLRFSRERR